MPEISLTTARETAQQDGGAPTGAAALAADFFISRAGADKALATSIALSLENAGHTVILQDWDFANHNFIERMHDALTRARRVVVVLSPDYLASPYCTAEWANAMAGDPLNRDGRLILFKVAACQPRGMLRALGYWNLMPLLGKAELLRDVVLAAIEPGRHKNAASALSPYRQPGEAVLHDRIREVPSFTGRREALDKLGAALWRADGGAVAITQAAAVHGGGGIGKTALAQHYGWAERERYAGVWWLRADSATRIEDGLIALGAEFIPGLAEVRDRAEAVRKALGFIEGAGFEKPWLLIYDNVETPGVLNGRTPRNGAQTLVTSRFPDWKGRAEPLALDVFEPDEAVAFLLDRTECDDRPGAARLAEALGWLALALDHAAAFCIETGDSFDDYRQLLAGWIKRAPENTDYPAPVFATFTLAIEKAAAKCPAAETLMAILAFMAPDAIPRDIVTEDVLDAMALREATAALKNVSLVKVEPQAEGGPLLGLHRLVQMVMRGRLAEAGEAEAFAAKALKLVADAFPSGEGANNPTDVRSWPACARLYPHAMTVLDPIVNHVKPGQDVGEAHDTAASATLLLNQAGLYLNSRANYAEAEPLMRRALAIDEASYGAGHPRVAIDLNNLAQLLQATNRLAEAEPLMRRALAIDEASYGADHPDVAIDLNNLALLLKATNRLAEAEPLMRRALAIDEASYGADHPDVAIRLNNLALLLKATNRLAEAEPLMRRALAIDEASYGASHPGVAIDLNNLAQLLQATNRLAEAEPLMRRALAIDEASYGADHPMVAIRLNNLAALLQATNRLAEAEPLMRRALAIDEASYGADHPKVAIRLNNLAALLQATNRLAEAEPLMRRALAIDEASYGADHPKVAIRLNNLAALLQATNRLAQAEKLMRRALAIDEASYGADHPKVAIRLNNLAALLQATNRLAQAEKLMRRALAIDEASYGADHPMVAIRLNNLAMLLQDTNRLAEAEPLMRRALAIVEASLPDHHPWVQGARANLAALLAAMGKT